MIYVIESGDYFKVGYAKNIKSRMIAYRCHNPSFKLIASFEGDKHLEQSIHLKLGNYKHRLEWFNKYPNYLEDITRMATGCEIKLECYLPTNGMKHLSSADITDENGIEYTLKDYANDKGLTEFKLKKVLECMIINKQCIIMGGYSNQINSFREHYILVNSFVEDFYRELRNA